MLLPGEKVDVLVLAICSLDVTIMMLLVLIL